MDTRETAVGDGWPDERTVESARIISRMGPDLLNQLVEGLERTPGFDSPEAQRFLDYLRRRVGYLRELGVAE